MVTSTINTQKPLSEYTPKELKSMLSTATSRGEYEDVEKIAKEIHRKENPELIQKEMDKAEAAKLAKIKSGKMSKKELQDYILNDLKTYKSTVTEKIGEVKRYKEEKIEELKAQLESKSEELHKAITAGPDIKEYISLERRSLVNMANSLRDLKEKDREHYPKNVLIFCMGMTNTRLLGARQMFKRGWFKLLRNRKKDEIKKELETLSKRLEADPNSKNAYREALKSMLRKEVEEAKKAYIEQVTQKTL